MRFVNYPKDIGWKALTAAGACLWVNILTGVGADHIRRDRSMFKRPENSFSLLKRELATHSARLPPDVGASRRYIFADNTLNMPLIVEAPVIGRCRTCRHYDSAENRCDHCVTAPTISLEKSCPRITTSHNTRITISHNRGVLRHPKINVTPLMTLSFGIHEPFRG